jgi:peptidyl-prolyl cis-trans isomerase A (cyclophilin A)/peptidyl-prolyl cis-trans isomerase B (cyclophilin B)
MHINKLLAALSFLLFSAACAAHPQVEIKTNLGSILLELYPDKAPKTVQNFLSYVKDGYYTGTVFHRVIPGFMIQGGGFGETYKQKPTRPPIENEAANGLRNETGTISMARTSDPHSASAQFFINVADNASLNHTARTTQGYGYTVFGKVVKGMEVVNRIAQAPTGPAGPFQGDVPKVPVVIEKIKLIAAEPAPNAGTSIN